MRFLVAIVLLALASTASSADERDAADYNASVGGVSFLVMRDGAVVFEDYPNGGARERAFDLASGTKSFSCAIAAAAVQDGLLDLDERASATLTEWKSDPRKARITVREVLSLTSGIRPTRIGRAPPYAEAAAQPAAAEPGAVFAYGPVNFQIFGEIVRRKLKSFEGGRYPDALAYLKARVLNPVGAAPAAWKKGRDGLPTLPQGAEFTARNWARYGQFALQGGRWKGAALVDVKAFGECFKGSAANPAYGLSWWLNEPMDASALKKARVMTMASDLFTHPRRAELPDDLFMAAGAGGQRLYVIPSMQLVVVRQYPRLVERRPKRGAAKFSDVEFLLHALSN
jgi:CubicO group peptidase (beta-lactamase class C family)